MGLMEMQLAYDHRMPKEPADIECCAVNWIEEAKAALANAEAAAKRNDFEMAIRCLQDLRDQMQGDMYVC